MLAAEWPKQEPLNQRKIRRLLENKPSLEYSGSKFFVIESYQQAIQPIFSVSDELVLRNFHSVLQNGLEDHALLSAVMLTFSFPSTARSLDQQSLKYQSQSMSYIRDRMSCPDKATTEPTLGAILLLARIEVCISPNGIYHKDMLRR
jgi:hypothetical protein